MAIPGVIPGPWLVVESAVHHESSRCSVDRADSPDMGEINTKWPAIFLLWTALSRDKLSIATLARYGRLSRSQGTSSSTIKPMSFARAAGFDDSVRDARALQHHEKL